MLPKKIYLNGGDENAVTICSREPITRSYGNTHSREYTDLSQVWHPATEEPQGDEWHIAYLNEVGEIRTLKQKSLTFYGFPTLRSFAKGAGALCWAYISDLLPKGGKQ